MTDEIAKDYTGLVEQYKKLKEDFDEQNTIYEEYIASLESSKKELETKLTQSTKDSDNYKKEASKLRTALADRNKDNDYLEKELEREQEKCKSIQDKLTKTESKKVDIELENTDLNNKIRELECWGDELKQKLEAALEENIILHTEYEDFKQECDEKIQRIQEELEDNKNEVLCKEKMIEKLTNHRDFLVKTAVKDSEELKNSIMNKSKDRSSSTLNKDVVRNALIQSSVRDDKRSERSGTIKSNKDSISNHSSSLVKKASENKNTFASKVPDKFVTQIGTSFINYSLDKNKDNINNENKDDEDKDFFMVRIQNEVRSILENRKNFLIATLNYDSFSFDILNVESTAKLGKIKAAVQVNEAIDEVLNILKDRKEKVFMQKRLLKAKFEKLGIKV